MKRTRGFTLMEILIAMALTTIVTAAVLAIVRTQLTAFEMNDQIVRTQQNARAGMDFVETTLRRACGGINSGLVYVYTPNLVSSTGVPCLRVWDGAAINSTSFTSSSPTTLPDAVEVVYASGSFTAVTGATPSATLATTTPSVTVMDTCNFNAGDYAILTDKDYKSPALFKISAVTRSGSCPSSTARPGTLSFGTLGVAPSVLPTVSGCVDDGKGVGSCTTNGTPVFKASTYSIFVVPSTASGSDAAYANMLMIDPDGIASSNHKAYGTTVQPAVEGVVDFQVAVGNDNSGTGAGNITDWIGDVSGETIPNPATFPWNSSTLSTMPQLRQVRLSLLLQTAQQYTGAPSTITPFEDRTTYPTFTAGAAASNPRYRSMRIIVAPRAWNLSE